MARPGTELVPRNSTCKHLPYVNQSDTPKLGSVIAKDKLHVTVIHTRYRESRSTVTRETPRPHLMFQISARCPSQLDLQHCPLGRSCREGSSVDVSINPSKPSRAMHGLDRASLFKVSEWSRQSSVWPLFAPSRFWRHCMQDSRQC